MKRFGTAISMTLMLAGCATPAMFDTPDVYSMQRDAQLAYDAGDDQQGEKLMQGLLRVAPNDAETWFRLGNLYARANKHEQAVEAYQHALMLKPGDARAWHNLGVVHIRQAAQALIQAHAMAADDAALRTKTERMTSLLEAVQQAGKP